MYENRSFSPELQGCSSWKLLLFVFLLDIHFGVGGSEISI